MPIQVAWDNNDISSEILVFSWSGQPTWHDCKEAFTQAELLSCDVETPVVHVFDLTANELPLRTLIPLLQKCLTMRLLHRARKTIIVERPHLVDLLSENLHLVLGDVAIMSVHVVDSLPRARALGAMH